MLKPQITEKTLLLAQTRNQYTFLVEPAATKNSSKIAIEKAFGVHVLDIKTRNIEGKVKRFGKKRTQSRTKSLKKVTVKLPEKEKIDLFEIEEKKNKNKKKK
ncbi:MAG: 50S ribosomal protein L23 [Candidatus Blackburnbacteria bacterium RIFCSPHIGHO2_01_FULL_44_64]|uniref:Large ribosomal subunit protein uL23 n=1 Tax=Candidatus Blackburnbacteria bacterium RIFCSPHIGHO2_02_FULL_44_20 TaxID=1797516 RepID=A0A1G1V8W3_9BACT|nr:MAG: 50S ribosomal protein L23 [Candidatus Blackburnbacteria bacterium RIFCSPHIGHO2_01_FULL_44_64]OGY11813.1 MAG: 50S ribosomal protein L23 [Candidatus Blackburnbacteria bacterium RIFCSPHIGHO2_12_FULL_44_25]OGY11860.1 MAG: 50S ribosomal protein L23 [Candidatus Blackburnbacteria bacterium RIFCSPHIGHO2_02_FULL_44_20]OGY14469.1 MAG: 50S ribosomal protein L23 [Candidatus Blackburnbacteria bacterium RIFCSPLOWO2_01_FULL_44_43]OGY15817.1 MAG: 50S ribosomal protein L23 [Candidatus Blackburnbacteria 